MSIVAYRLYCIDCDNTTVVREDRMDDHIWRVESKTNHRGLCPQCNELVDMEDVDDDYSRDQEDVPFEQLDAIGEGGAENLRENGIVTRGDVKDASDEEILSVAWVGDAGLESIRREVQ